MHGTINIRCLYLFVEHFYDFKLFFHCCLSVFQITDVPHLQILANICVWGREGGGHMGVLVGMCMCVCVCVCFQL